jgi:hypothetical protein
LNTLADEIQALSDDTVAYTVPPYTPFANGFPAVLENSPNRFALTNGDGWEVSFFYYPFAAEAFIVGFRDGKHRRHTSDAIRNTNMIVEYDQWIPVELARDYWRFLVKDCGCKRIK